MLVFKTRQEVMLVNETNNDIGSRFRLIRGSMKQVDFAKLLDVNRSYVAQVETNGIKPSLDYLTKVALKFNVSSDWLLLGKDNVINQDNIMQTILTNTEYAKGFVKELMEKLIEEKQEWVLIEAVAALSKNEAIEFAFKSYIAEQQDDPILRDIIKYLKMTWYMGDDKIKNWLEIQFQKCFPDYLEELQKNDYEEDSTTQLA
jgi:transcriptional regulator with XRE-family HTH domain